jgi:hypothetical protein
MNFRSVPPAANKITIPIRIIKKPKFARTDNPVIIPQNIFQPPPFLADAPAGEAGEGLNCCIGWLVFSKSIKNPFRLFPEHFVKVDYQPSNCYNYQSSVINNQ